MCYDCIFSNTKFKRKHPDEVLSLIRSDNTDIFQGGSDSLRNDFFLVNFYNFDKYIKGFWERSLPAEILHTVLGRSYKKYLINNFGVNSLKSWNSNISSEQCKCAKRSPSRVSKDFENPVLIPDHRQRCIMPPFQKIYDL